MNYDITIVRPEIRSEDLKHRGEGFSSKRLNDIKKGLITLHTLEIMATNIYKFQITTNKNSLNKELIDSMVNEMTHIQDFQAKLYEYGFRPSKLRWVFWIGGFIIGYGSRLFGKKAILKVGIWVETKAVTHYGDLLKNIEWDGDTKKIIEKNLRDEQGHIDKWNKLLNRDDGI